MIFSVELLGIRCSYVLAYTLTIEHIFIYQFKELKIPNFVDKNITEWTKKGVEVQILPVMEKVFNVRNNTEQKIAAQ